MGGIAALIVAAGRGVRAGGDLPKQYRRLGGKMLLSRTIDAFVSHPKVEFVQCVINPSDAALYHEACGQRDLLPPAHGGATRQDSVRNGLAALAKQTPTHVLIHDAARPFVSAPLIDRVIDALSSTKGAIPALPVSDTLKRGKDGEIVATIDRADLFRAQTPQGFWYVDICNAHAAAKSDQLTDDGAVAEAAGMTVSLVDGDQDNIKLTEPEDFETGEHMLGFQASTNVTRTGQGFDVHRFGEGAHVTLCGLDIPHTHGLVGHSDADVALHALTDALLGAIGAGDIGDHFPPSDPKWRGAASEKFLSFSAELIVERGGSINNVDVTIICEAPKIGPHRSAMRHRIAEILALDEAAVSVKATTTERLGFTGRGEGIAAQAIATINMRAKK